MIISTFILSICSMDVGDERKTSHFSFFHHAFTENEIPLLSTGCVRVTGQQGNHVLAIVDQNIVHAGGIDDADTADDVGHGFPQIRDDDFIAHFQIGDVSEVRGSAPTTMTGNDSVGVPAADGNAGLGQHCSAVCHVLITVVVAKLLLLF